MSRKISVVLSLFLLFLASFCVSHLKEAKFHYAQGERLSRAYKTQTALASFKRALAEAEIEAKKNPSAQAYMLKGMAEMNIDLWEQAEESFITAFTLGFQDGEGWAREISLFGLASSFQKMGLEDSALEIYTHLLGKAKLKQVTFLTSQKYVDITLKEALQKKGNERMRLLTDLLKRIERLINRDMSNGFYHYLHSQILGHLSEYKKSFEKAVTARELGLPTQEIYRDNDMQIVFCYKNIREELKSDKWNEFNSLYLQWIKKWNWQGPEIPDWKRK